MAMRHPKLVVFAGAMSALAVMTVISTALGFVVPNLISRKTTGLLAGCLYTFFGLRLMYIAYHAGNGKEATEACSLAFCLQAVLLLCHQQMLPSEQWHILQLCSKVCAHSQVKLRQGTPIEFCNSQAAFPRPMTSIVG
jgi:exosortase/archaeosortase